MSHHDASDKETQLAKLQDGAAASRGHTFFYCLIQYFLWYILLYCLYNRFDGKGFPFLLLLSDIFFAETYFLNDSPHSLEVRRNPPTLKRRRYYLLERRRLSLHRRRLRKTSGVAISRKRRTRTSLSGPANLSLRARTATDEARTNTHLISRRTSCVVSALSQPAR